jgi:predicted lipoprotein
MANITTNTDVDYVQKDFNSTVDAIISFANVNFGPGTSANRLWTNFNADSFSRNW